MASTDEIIQAVALGGQKARSALSRLDLTATSVDKALTALGFKLSVKPDRLRIDWTKPDGKKDYAAVKRGGEKASWLVPAVHHAINRSLGAQGVARSYARIVVKRARLYIDEGKRWDTAAPAGTSLTAEEKAARLVLVALADGKALPYDGLEGLTIHDSAMQRLVERLGFTVERKPHPERGEAWILWRADFNGSKPLRVTHIRRIEDLVKPEPFQLPDGTTKQATALKRAFKAKAQHIVTLLREAGDLPDPNAELRTRTLKKLRSWAATGLTLKGIKLVAPQIDGLEAPRRGVSIDRWLMDMLRDDEARVESIRAQAAALLGVPLQKQTGPKRTRDYLTDFTIRTCPVCFRDIKATDNGRIVHHGFTIEGRDSGGHGGYRRGACPGTGALPWERSPQGLKRGIPAVEAQAARALERLRGLRAGTVSVSVKHTRYFDHGRRKKEEWVTLKPGETKTVDGTEYTHAKAARQQAAAVRRDLASMFWTQEYPGIPWLRAAVRTWKPGSPDKPAVGAPSPTVTLLDRRGDPFIVDALEQHGRVDTAAWWRSEA